MEAVATIGERAKRWYMPLAMLGVGGIGAFLLSDRGRQAIRWVVENVEHHQRKFSEWNEAAERELDRLEEALDRVAASIEAIE
jgi:hypothetical protein